MIKILDKLFKKYWELGYEVREVCMPKEFKKDLEKEIAKKTRVKKIRPIDMVENDFSIAKIFVNQSKHFQIIIEPKKKKK